MRSKLFGRLMSFTLSATVALTSGIPSLAFDGGGEALPEEDEEIQLLEEEEEIGSDFDASEEIVEDEEEFFAIEDEEAELESADDVAITIRATNGYFSADNIADLYNTNHGDGTSATSTIPKHHIDGYESRFDYTERISADSALGYSFIVNPVDGYEWADGTVVSEFAYTDYSSVHTGDAGVPVSLKTEEELAGKFTVSDYTGNGTFQRGTKLISIPSATLTSILSKCTDLDGKKRDGAAINIKLKPAAAAKYTMTLGAGIGINNKSVSNDFLTGTTTAAKTYALTDLVDVEDLIQANMKLKVTLSAGSDGSKAVERTFGSDLLETVDGTAAQWESRDWARIYNDDGYKVVIDASAIKQAYLNGRTMEIAIDASEAGSIEKYDIVKDSETYVRFMGTNSSTALPEEGATKDAVLPFTVIAKNASADGIRLVKSIWYKIGTGNAVELVANANAQTASATIPINTVKGKVTLGATTTETGRVTVTYEGEDASQYAAIYGTDGKKMSRVDTGSPYKFVIHVNGQYAVESVKYNIGNEKKNLVPSVSGDVYTTEAITDTLQILITLQKEANQYTVTTKSDYIGTYTDSTMTGWNPDDPRIATVRAANGEVPGSYGVGNVISTVTVDGTYEKATKGYATGGKPFFFTVTPATGTSINKVTYDMTPDGGTKKEGLVPTLIDQSSALYRIDNVTGPVQISVLTVASTVITAPANESVNVSFTSGQRISTAEDFTFSIAGKKSNIAVTDVYFYDAGETFDSENSHTTRLGKGDGTYTILSTAMSDDMKTNGIAIYAYSETTIDPSEYKAEFIVEGEDAYEDSDTVYMMDNTYSSTVKKFQNLTSQTLRLNVGESAVLFSDSASGFSVSKNAAGWAAATPVPADDVRLSAPKDSDIVDIDQIESDPGESVEGTITVTGNKAGSVELTAKYIEEGSDGNVFIRTAKLPVVVTDRFTEFTLKSTNDGIFAGPTPATFTVFAKNGRTGKVEPVVTSDFAIDDITNDKIDNIKFTIKGYKETAATKNYWMHSVNVDSGADNSDKTGTRVIDYNTINKNAKVFADKGQEEPITVEATITLADDSKVTVDKELYIVEAPTKAFAIVAWVEVDNGNPKEYYEYDGASDQIGLVAAGNTQKKATITYQVLEDAEVGTTVSRDAANSANPAKAIATALKKGQIVDITSQVTFSNEAELIQYTSADVDPGETAVSAKVDPIVHATVTSVSNGVYEVTAVKKLASNNLRLQPSITYNHVEDYAPQVVFTVADRVERVKVRMLTTRVADTVAAETDVYVNKLGTTYITGKGTVSEVVYLEDDEELLTGKHLGYEFTDVEIGASIVLPKESDFSTTIETKKKLAGFDISTTNGTHRAYKLPGDTIVISEPVVITAIWWDAIKAFTDESLRNTLVSTSAEDEETEEIIVTYDNPFKDQELQVGSRVPLALRVETLVGIDVENADTTLTDADFEWESEDITSGFELAQAATSTAYSIVDKTIIKAEANNLAATLKVKGTYKGYDIPDTPFTVNGENEYELKLKVLNDEIEAGTTPITITAELKDGSEDLTEELTKYKKFKREWTVSSSAGTIKSDFVEGEGIDAATSGSGGDTATFTPLAKADKVTVTLKVTDDNGISVSKSIDLKITQAKVKIEFAENTADRKAITSVDALANQSSTGRTTILARAINTADNSTDNSGGIWALSSADDQTDGAVLAAGGDVTTATEGYRTIAISTQNNATTGVLTAYYTANSGTTYQAEIPVETYYAVVLAGNDSYHIFITEDTIPVKDATTYAPKNVVIKVKEADLIAGTSGSSAKYGPVSLAKYSAVTLTGNAQNAKVDEARVFSKWNNGLVDGTTIKAIPKSSFTSGVLTVDPLMKDADAILSGVPTTVTIANSAKLAEDTYVEIKAGVRPDTTTADLLVTATDHEFFALFGDALAGLGSSVVADDGSYKLQDAGFNGTEITATPALTYAINGDITGRTDTFTIGAVSDRAGTTTIQIYSVDDGVTSIPAKAVPVKEITLNVNGLDNPGGSIPATYWENGQKVKSAMRKVGSVVYYFDEDGNVITEAGVKVIDGKRILFMTGGTVAPKGVQDYKNNTYFVGEDGEILSGWITSTGVATSDASQGVYYADPAKDDTLANNLYKVGNDYYAFKNYAKQKAASGTVGYALVKATNENEYYVDTEGKVAVAKIGVVDGKDRLFREDGTIVKHTDSDVIGGKITVAGVGYVIADDDSAKLDDVLYNAKVTWTKRFDSKYTKGTGLPQIQYTIEYTSKNSGKKETTEVRNAIVACDGDYSETSIATELTFTATAVLAGFWNDSEATTPATATPITQTYKFKDGGKEGISGQEIGGNIFVEGLEESYYYTGVAIKPVVTVTDDGKPLAQGVDYTVKYTNNTKISPKNSDGEYTASAQIIITGKGNYEGQGQTLAFAIIDPKDAVEEDDVDLSSYTLSLPKEDLFYTGEAVYPSAIILKAKGGSAVTYEHKGDGDYGDLPAVVAFSNNVKKGTAKLTLTGKPNAKGSTKVLKKSFTIKAVSMKDNKDFTIVAPEDASWAKNGAKPSVTVTWDGYGDLIEGQDYKVSYSKNKALGTATVKVTGKGNFAKTAEATFAVVALPVTEEMVAAVSAFDKTKGAKVTILDLNGDVIPANKFAVSVLDEDGKDVTKEKLVGEKPYTVVIKAAKPEVTTDEDGISVSVVAGFKLNSAKVDAKSVVKTYSGEPITLDEEDIAKIAVTYKKAPLVYGEDYEISGYKNNVKKGSMTVTIKGIGKYSGFKTFKVKIAPKPITKASN